VEPAARHVLVVDDERENLRLLGNLLGGSGYQVHVAESGGMALAVAREINREGRLDVILLDILMPGDIDGIEVCRRLKSWPEMRNTPVVFLTGKDDRETMMRAFEAGGADYVLKPFNTDVLLARARTHARLGLLSTNLESALAESTRELRERLALLGGRLSIDSGPAGTRASVRVPLAPVAGTADSDRDTNAMTEEPDGEVLSQ
jgi:DNA-binding response OmpR family regulator